jgi:hypothetical protein
MSRILLAICFCFALSAASHGKSKPLPPPEYKEGVRDYHNGTCYRARPYDDGPKFDLWKRGFQDALRRDHNRVNRSHCRPSPAAAGRPTN